MSIFNKRQEEAPPAPRPAAAPPSNFIEPKKEATPLSSTPFKTPEQPPDSTRVKPASGKP